MISVVVPTFQRRATVTGAVESALGQQPAPLEIIVVDDGSTDGTAAELRSRFAGTVRLVEQPNRGPSAARNAGVDAACGDVIAFLDSDDRWLPHHLRVLTELFDAYPEAVLAGTQRNFEFGAGRRSDACLVDLAVPLLRDSEDVGVLPSVAVRRDVFLAAGGFDERLRYGEDTELFMRLALYGPFALVSASTVDVGASADSLEGVGRAAGAYVGFFERSADSVLAALEHCSRPDEELLRAAARARRAIGHVVTSLANDEPVETVRVHLTEVHRWAPDVDAEELVIRAVSWIVPGWERPDTRRHLATTLRAAARE